MLRIILAGFSGRMGDEVIQYCRKSQDLKIVAGFSRSIHPEKDCPVFTTPEQCNISADVLIDFSRPESIDHLLPYCISHRLPAVLGVTGYSQNQMQLIYSACRSIPIFRAANFSIGANTLLKLVQYAAISLAHGFDVDIIERHHKNKLDSPSGTALLLSSLLQTESDIKSIRSGTTAGEHTVLFAGSNEVLTLTHRADTREVYAAGAIRAAQFIVSKKTPGLYGMEDLLGNQ